MVCIYCGNNTQVINSRAQKRLGTVWRRRKCTSCDAIFTTTEQPDLAAGLRIRLQDGSLARFERDRLFVSVVEALGHREDAVSAAGALTNTIISKLVPQNKDAVLNRAIIIDESLAALKRFDIVAATYYAAYHR